MESRLPHHTSTSTVLNPVRNQIICIFPDDLNPVHLSTVVEMLWCVLALQNVPPGRTTGELYVEDGISKKDRAEHLKKKREERKAKRKQQGMQRPAAASTASIRNRRISAPAIIMPSTVEVPSEATAPRIPATPPRTAFEAQRPGEGDPVQAPSMPSQDNEEAENTRATPIASTSSLSAGEHGEVAAVPPSSQPESTGEAVAVPPPAIRPPPTFFDPTNVPPPPVGPPSAAASSRAPPSRHPSIAFNVNETVEKALTEARREACVAERRAAFWKCRFRDLAVWSASFVVLAYASDHSFEQDC